LGPLCEPTLPAPFFHIKQGTYFHSGSGALYKSYSFAGNIAYQYYKILTAPQEQVDKKVFLLADYEPFSLRDYCNQIAGKIDASKIITLPLPIAYLFAGVGSCLNFVGWKSFPYNWFRLNNIRTEYVYDLSATKEVCGDLPYDFEAGVAQTAQWLNTKV
jgi:hypothetical protein